MYWVISCVLAELLSGVHEIRICGVRVGITFYPCNLEFFQDFVDTIQHCLSLHQVLELEWFR